MKKAIFKLAKIIIAGLVIYALISVWSFLETRSIWFTNGLYYATDLGSGENYERVSAIYDFSSSKTCDMYYFYYLTDDEEEIPDYIEKVSITYSGYYCKHIISSLYMVPLEPYQYVALNCKGEKVAYMQYTLTNDAIFDWLGNELEIEEGEEIVQESGMIYLSHNEGQENIYIDDITFEKMDEDELPIILAFYINNLEYSNSD
jgi:hypothetical protein